MLNRTLNKKTILLITVFFSLISVIALFLNMSYLQSNEKTKVFHRIYKQEFVRFSHTFKFEGYVPQIIYFDKKLYFNDYNNHQIIELDTLGEILNQYPKTSNKKTLSSIDYFDVDKDGIYMVDYKKRTITLVGFENSIKYEYTTDILIDRINRLKDNQFLIKSYDRDAKFSVTLVDAKKNTENKLDYPLPDVKHSGLKLSGFYSKNQNGVSFYICWKAGLFFCVNQEGQFQYLSKTIDETPLPKIIESNNAKSLRYDPLMPLVNISADADEKYLYILSNIKTPADKNAASNVVDVYRVLDGKYQFSFKIPDYKDEKLNVMKAVPNGFYFVYGDDYIVFFTASIQKNVQ